MPVGTALRRRRVDRGLSATALARAVGISNGHLSDIERGRRNPSPGLLRRLEDVLELSPGELQNQPFVVPKPPTLGATRMPSGAEGLSEALFRWKAEATPATTAALATALGVAVEELLPSEEPRPWPTPAHHELAVLVALMLRVDPQAGIAARGIPDIALLSEPDVELIARTVREALTWALGTVTRRPRRDADAEPQGPNAENAMSETSGRVP